MLQLPEAQLGSNANQHLHDIYSHCQSGTCLFSEHCILNRKIKMNWWRWEMTSSQAKHAEKYRLWGNGDSGRWLQGDAQPAPMQGPGTPPWHSAAGTHPPTSRDTAAPCPSRHILVPSHPGANAASSQHPRAGPQRFLGTGGWPMPSGVGRLHQALVLRPPQSPHANW